MVELSGEKKWVIYCEIALVAHHCIIRIEIINAFLINDFVFITSWFLLLVTTYLLFEPHVTFKGKIAFIVYFMVIVQV